MKRLLIFCIVVCSLCINTNAQLLYEISGNGITKSSYLFGTHHMIPIDKVVEIPGVFRAFNDCDAVISEFVDDNPEEMQRQILAASKMELSILDLLNEEEENLIDSALQAELGLSLTNVQYMRPNVIAMIYEMTMYERIVAQKQDDMSIDSYFQVAATELGKAVYGLETLDKQLDILLRSVSLEQQAKNLIETIRSADNIKQLNFSIDSAYTEGNIDLLYELLLKEEEMTEAEKFLLVDERNLDWLSKIEMYIKSEPCFIAVGALHLPGKEGLINILRKTGYKVKEVK